MPKKFFLLGTHIEMKITLGTEMSTVTCFVSQVLEIFYFEYFKPAS